MPSSAQVAHPHLPGARTFGPGGESAATCGGWAGLEWLGWAGADYLQSFEDILRSYSLHPSAYATKAVDFEQFAR